MMGKVLFANGSGRSAQFHQLKTSRFLFLLLDLRRLKPIQLGQALADWQAGVWRSFESKNWHQGQLNDRPVKRVHRFFQLKISLVTNFTLLYILHSTVQQPANKTTTLTNQQILIRRFSVTRGTLAIETIKNSWLEQHDDRCAPTQCASDCGVDKEKFSFLFFTFPKIAPPFVVDGYWCDNLCISIIMRRTVSIVELPSSSSSSLSSNTACSSSAWPAAAVRPVPLRSSTESQLSCANKMGAGQSRRRPLDRTSAQCQPTIARTYQTLPHSSRRPLGSFRDDFGPPLSSSSTYSSSSDATLSYYPSPNKFPKTNPYVAARPRTDPKFGFATVRRVGPIAEEEPTTTSTATSTTTTTTSTTTDSAITGSRSSGTNSPSLQSSTCEQKAQMKRIVSGLKAFGIKVVPQNKTAQNDKSKVHTHAPHVDRIIQANRQTGTPFLDTVSSDSSTLHRSTCSASSETSTFENGSNQACTSMMKNEKLKKPDYNSIQPAMSKHCFLKRFSGHCSKLKVTPTVCHISQGQMKRKKPNTYIYIYIYHLTGIQFYPPRELYVSVILNRSLLTICADEARNLQPPPGSTSCNAYIRLSLMPDEEKRTQYKSEIVPGSNSPVFNQNVTFELLPEDSRKRLLISVWNRDCNTQKGGLLGCMAFSVRSILQTKQIEGWYYLLSPHYGRQKHLAVDKVNMLTYYGSIDCSKKPQHNNNNNNHGCHRVGPIFL
ncbi:Regulator of G-protein signaling 3 [Trichinella patagoniensis]|uniref:Regulator of G-protein signaling 3 n=1 Tax=Trichinella patagoniensis TaxID=990121 RepID=A0A0V0ZLV4_9BILA|nr:Regulator of G-protein signaling 3 [Trichinella patagoniensis]